MEKPYINYFPTGNEMISIPTIREDGAIESFNFIHMGYRGLIEVCGSPLIKPVISVNNKEDSLNINSAERISYWIPKFTGYAGDIKFTGTIFAPRGSRGFIYSLEAENTGEQRTIFLGFEGSWKESLRSINESSPIEGIKQAYRSSWTDGPMFDFKNGITLFSFGFYSDDKFHIADFKKGKDIISYKFGNFIDLKKGEKKSVNIYLGTGLEEVGAAASAIDMKRHGKDNLKSDLIKWLDKKTENISEDEYINKIYNTNLIFNYFYSSGITIDTEELVLVTSRSPRYYVSAAYWDRDSLLWSFPSLLKVDREQGKEVIKYVFTKQIKNVGIHSRYIDGTVLEPGFELDELCAPILALQIYIDITKDYSILKKDYVENGIEVILKKLESRKHVLKDIYETFLMPTDDMNDFPYITYDNVLVWKLYIIMSKFSKISGSGEKEKEYLEKAEKVKQAVYNNLVTETGNRKIFAWASDLAGRKSIYDEPPGSLTLLAHLGFCSREDEIFKNTYDFIYSDKYSHYFVNTEFEETGCNHAEHPWILSIGNSLLNGRKREAIKMLKKTQLDNFIACESIDEYTGKCTTGGHFATCAGYLSYALYEAYK